MFQQVSWTRERGDAHGGHVIEAPNFREIQGGWGDIFMEQPYGFVIDSNLVC
jgi:hypothetical protein